MSSKGLRAALGGLCLLAGVDVHAGVTAERTRVIFHADQRETSLLLVNQNSYPVIVQTWIDDGDLDSTPDSAQAPIMPLPPVFRLDSGRQRSLRLLHTGQAMPEDRESLYWLNLYEIPPQPGEPLPQGQSRLTVTLRTQLKVIYRPKALKVDAENAPRQLRFALAGDRLRVENPTPHFVTLASVTLHLDQGSQLLPGELLAPWAQATLAVAHGLAAGGQVRFTWIDDDGNGQSATAPLR